MKKNLIYAVMMSLAVLMTACSNNDDMLTDSVSAEKAKNKAEAKTVLIYMAGRNDLSDSLNADLDEIMEGSRLIGENNNLVVFVRRYNDAEQPWLARIKNGEVIDSVSLGDMGITSSDGQNRASDPIVMEGVMRYAFSRYPAINGNYGLVLWGHGSGWLMKNEVNHSGRRAFGTDYGSYIHSHDERCINIPTMAGILKELPHLRFIMADCCNFMCLENLYELRNVADYIIGSPAEIPSCGAPYEQILPDLFANGQFYSSIIDKYYTSMDGNLPLTAVMTSEMDNVAQATRQALQEIDCSYPDMTGIIHYYYTSKNFKFRPEYRIFYDAGDFIRTYAPADVYQQWRQALDKAVVYSKMAVIWDVDKVWRLMYTDFTVTEEKFHGVSMFVPQDPSLGDYARYNEEIKQMAWYGVTEGAR